MSKQLAMYDIRGIQSYIFKTNKLKEIIGASKLVEDVIMLSLDEVFQDYKKEFQEFTYFIKWEEQKEFKDVYHANVLFVGGGNAYVIYADKLVAHNINQRLARKILEKTYSLQLATAMVEISGNYTNDYEKIQKRMSEVKSAMPKSTLLGALPIVLKEMSTGFPITRIYKSEPVSEETYLKLSKADKMEGTYISLDEMTKRFEDSTIAIVHIDGNNMGQRIRNLLSGVSAYEKAIPRIREISKNIKNSFKETYEDMENKSNAIQDNMSCIQKIILGGDDVTFVCKGKYALSLTEWFLKDIMSKKMYGENKEEDLINYGFTACAGIAYVHSHFPFSFGYEIAEQCCSSAKKAAKLSAREGMGNVEINNGSDPLQIIGSYVDFQICKEVQAVNLQEFRRKNYNLPDETFLLRRPYYIPFREDNSVWTAVNLQKRNKECNIEDFKKDYNYFKIIKGFSRKLRDAYAGGKHEVKQILEYGKAKGKIAMDDVLSTEEAYIGDQENIAAWYDAVEMIDLYEEVGING